MSEVPSGCREEMTTFTCAWCKKVEVFDGHVHGTVEHGYDSYLLCVAHLREYMEIMNGLSKRFGKRSMYGTHEMDSVQQEMKEE